MQGDDEGSAAAANPPMICCLCGDQCEPWYPGSPGYGHNPWPLSEDPKARCCDACNNDKVIPTRINALYTRRNKER